MYEVEFTRQATSEFDEIFHWYCKQSHVAAEKWIAAIEAALDELERNPQRFPLAREKELRDVLLHERTIGAGKRLTHRLIFAIRPNKVVVYTIYHLSRRDLTIEDLS